MHAVCERYPAHSLKIHSFSQSRFRNLWVVSIIHQVRKGFLCILRRKCPLFRKEMNILVGSQIRSQPFLCKQQLLKNICWKRRPWQNNSQFSSWPLSTTWTYIGPSDLGRPGADYDLDVAKPDSPTDHDKSIMQICVWDVTIEASFKQSRRRAGVVLSLCTESDSRVIN